MGDEPKGKGQATIHARQPLDSLTEPLNSPIFDPPIIGQNEQKAVG